MRGSMVFCGSSYWIDPATAMQSSKNIRSVCAFLPRPDIRIPLCRHWQGGQGNQSCLPHRSTSWVGPPPALTCWKIKSQDCQDSTRTQCQNQIRAVTLVSISSWARLDKLWLNFEWIISISDSDYYGWRLMVGCSWCDLRLQKEIY